MILNIVIPIIIFLIVCNLFYYIFYKYIAYDITGKIENTNWKCMNYGYYPPLVNGVEKYQLSLYENLIKNISITNKKIIEISSGRGGGLSHIVKKYKPLQATGLDYSKTNIDFCKKTYKSSNIKFITGNSMDIKLNNNSFDIVLNVEASHAYDDKYKFFKEVSRILKPSGIFCYADFVNNVDFAKIIHVLSSLFSIISIENITPNVLKSLEYDSDRKIKLVNSFDINAIYKYIAKQLYGVKDSYIYNKFKNQHKIYYIIICKIK